jgi:hypothetical protein
VDTTISVDRYHMLQSALSENSASREHFPLGGKNIMGFLCYLESCPFHVAVLGPCIYERGTPLSPGGQPRPHPLKVHIASMLDQRKNYETADFRQMSQTLLYPAAISTEEEVESQTVN